MQKKVTFDKKIEFPTMIGEISAISLDQELEFIDNTSITGNLLLTGKYKLTEASRVEEDFSYKIPVEIALTKEVDKDTGNIEISDFSYDLDNGNELICFIELLISGEDISEERECDGDVSEKEIEIPILEDNEEDREEVESEDQTVNETDLFSDLEEDNETYGTFVVYMIRQDETINTILEKYNTTLEEIEKYNEIKDLKVGTKLIIPLLNE